MSWWKKCVLLGALVWLHIAAIFGIGSSLRGTTFQTSSSGAILEVQLNVFGDVALPPEPEPVADAPTSARIRSSAGQRPAAKKFAAISMPMSNVSVLNRVEERQQLKAEDFLSAEEVDETANPVGNFEETLRHGLPLYVQGLVIEFWIDYMGNTVQIRCIQGDCSDAMTTGLEQFLTLLFVPAVKEGLAVPSRKLIQIEPSSLF